MTKITITKPGTIILIILSLVLLAFFLVRGVVYGRTDYIDNCSEARARHLTNIPRGSVYYRPSLDRDNNGIACQA